jgi:hypothetical protein
MKGYVARKGDRWCAVMDEGLDPVTVPTFELITLPAARSEPDGQTRSQWDTGTGASVARNRSRARK